MTPLAAGDPLLLSLLAVKRWSKMLSMSARDDTAIAPPDGRRREQHHPGQERHQQGEGRLSHLRTARTSGWRRLHRRSDRYRQRRGDDPYSQAALINEIGTTCAPPSQDSINHQRILFNLRDEAKGLPGLRFGVRR